jgi:hypothetical protein
LFELRTFELRTFELRTFELRTFELRTVAEEIGPFHFSAEVEPDEMLCSTRNPDEFVRRDDGWVQREIEDPIDNDRRNAARQHHGNHHHRSGEIGRKSAAGGNSLRFTT